MRIPGATIALAFPAKCRSSEGMQKISSILFGCALALTSLTAFPHLTQADEAAGKAYLEKNKEKEGVTVTESGLQYEVLEEGKEDGKSPGATDTVVVHYKGTLTDGTEFDSSYSRGKPATFPLNRVIPGWTEGVQLMKEGAKYRFVVPSDLAYGAGGAPPKIGPNETLVFVVELLEVK